MHKHMTGLVCANQSLIFLQYDYFPTLHYGNIDSKLNLRKYTTLTEMKIVNALPGTVINRQIHHTQA